MSNMIRAIGRNGAVRNARGNRLFGGGNVFKHGWRKAFEAFLHSHPAPKRSRIRRLSAGQRWEQKEMANRIMNGAELHPVLGIQVKQ